MKKVLAILIASSTMLGCSKLDEKLNGTLDASQVSGSSSGSAAALLQGTYDAMLGPFQSQDRLWCLQEHTTDEVIGPTRAGDWDDNGVWRVLHSHQWDPNHDYNLQTFRELGKVIFAATDLLRFSPTPQQEAEARLLRAYASYALLDGWDQVPFRVNTADPKEVPQVRKGLDALEYIISEITEILPNLPQGPSNKANKDGAKVLLMKCYLNKGVFANREAPVFDAADMNKVITLANEIAVSPRNYAFASNFFDNFAPNNDGISNELIWSAENIAGVKSGNVRSHWFCTLHYNQNPSGWNGFTTLSDFYDKFDANDQRRGVAYDGLTNVTGLRAGFLVGQQYTYKTSTPVPSNLPPDSALNDRTGAPLVFTPEVKSIEVGTNLEVTGIRVVKYLPDYNNGDNKDNDYVYFRITDVLLMKAEALLRGGTDPNGQTASGIVNTIRTHPSRGAAAIGTVTLDDIIDERGRELYWEGHRRSDLIRFGKFLEAWQEKNASGPERLLFPIPSRSLAANPNLTQNPGY